MCTLTFAWRAFEDAPLVVAANRDEALERPSATPSLTTGDPAVLAPLDERAGGTWIGANDAGVFAGVTNRWTDAELAGERSRGRLVRDALEEPTAAAATALVADAVDDDEYDGFNLLVADADDCTYLEWDGGLAVEPIDPGVGVVVNVGRVGGFELPSHRRERAEAQAANARAVHDELQVQADETASTWRERAAAVLADHDYGVCVHGDGFGTRSSSLIAVDADGAVAYWFADGPPCEVEYARVATCFEGEV